jgi:hypothetical protein
MTDKELVNVVDALFKCSDVTAKDIQRQLKLLERDWGVDAVSRAVITCTQIAYMRLPHE